MSQAINFVRSTLCRKDTLTAITATPQNSSAIGVDGCNYLNLEVQFTFVAGTAFILTFDVSEDGSTWSQVTSTDTAAGTGTRVRYTDSTATNSASKNFEVKLRDIQKPYIRYSYSATAGTTDSAIVFVRTGYSA